MIIFSHQLLHPQLLFFFLGGGSPNQKTPCMFDFGCERPSTMVRNPTGTCFVAKSVLSRVPRAMRGGSQKVTNDDEGEVGGHDTPQKWWRNLWTAPNGDDNDDLVIVHLFQSCSFRCQYDTIGLQLIWFVSDLNVNSIHWILQNIGSCWHSASESLP